ncbi:hypothetical protein V8D89_015681 [Ganoderma adspersum]
MAATSLPPGLHDAFYLILSHLAPKPTEPNPNVISFNETPDSTSARKDLACLARAHRSFTQPTLAVLWRSLPSQKPLELLLCAVGMAQRLPDSARLDGLSLEMCETPASHRSGWIRFQEYASLVREIVIDPLTDTTDVPAQEHRQGTLWDQLCSTFLPTPILPRLERAAIRTLTKNPLAIDMGVLRLLNPALRLGGPVLSIEIPTLAPVLNIELLRYSHPHLRYLKLNDPALPNLEYLHTNLSPSTAAATRLSRRITFAGLRGLAVSCSEVTTISDLLAHLNAPLLQTFSVCEAASDPSAEPLPQELSNSLRTLVARCPSLTAFEWSSTVQSGARRAGHLVRRRSTGIISLAEFFAPLLSHRTMRRFSVRFGSGGPVVSCAPADFRAVVEAWPDLETFRLHDDGDHSGWGAGSSASSQCQWGRVDLESAFAFARHCPRLRVLHFARVELVVGNFGSNVARCPPEPHAALRELHMGMDIPSA